MEITSVEQYISYYMATNMMKEALGDGMEFEIVYQAILDQIQSQTSANGEGNNVIASNSNLSLDSMQMTMIGEELNKYQNNGPINIDLSSLNSILGGSDTVASIMESLNSNTANSVSSSSGAGMDAIYSVVDKYSSMYNVDSDLVLAIIKAESNFNPSATSGAGAQGLMQVMPSNLQSMGVTNGYDIEQNINAGVKLLSSYLNQFNGNVEMALMAYNGGPGTMQRRGVSSSSDLYKMPTETQNYVPKVLGYYSEFSA